MKKRTFIIALTLVKLCSGYDALKDYVGDSDFKVGVAINSNNFDDEKYVEAASNFNMAVAENACKLSGIQHIQGNYDFRDCDNHLKFAQNHNMEFRGHCLVWHSYQPKWFESITDAKTMENAIVEYITNVLTHYKGKIKAWDVVNEAIDDDSPMYSFNFRDSFIYRALPNFVDIAFTTARKVDPDVKLFYNDYSTEGKWPKTTSVYKFIEDLVQRNIPIDGVGLQYHTSVQNQPTFEKINETISKYCELGIEVHITEIDVDCSEQCSNKSIEKLQSEVYSNALKACLGNSCCTAFLVWGVADKNSWLGEDKLPLLFDNDFQPKTQYNQLLNVLKDTLGETIDKEPSNDNKITTPTDSPESNDSLKSTDSPDSIDSPNSTDSTKPTDSNYSSILDENLNSSETTTASTQATSTSTSNTEKETDIPTDSGALSILRSAFSHFKSLILFYMLIIYAYYIVF